MNENPPNYKTFDFTEQTRHHFSSDFDNIDTGSLTPITPSFEYSLIQLFYVQLIFLLYYLIDEIL